MEEPFLILDITSADSWAPLHFVSTRSPADPPRRIADVKRPTVLQTDRGQAEAEVMRLATASPGRTFALFELTHVSAQVPFVTHVNLHGMALQTRTVHRLLPVGKAEPPVAAAPLPTIDRSLLDTPLETGADDADEVPF